MIKTFKGNTPDARLAAFIAHSADIIGNVVMKKNSSVWYNAVIRGDVSSITIGENTNIQDGAVLHCDEGAELEIGNNVTVGHNAILHGAKINHNCIIGMGAVVLNNAVIGENSIVGAGALVPEGKNIPSNSLVVGIPGKVIRTLSEDEIKGIEISATHYAELSKQHSE